jgi:hypothetical protein
MKKGRMDREKGRSLVWVLAQMRSMVEAQALANIEARLTQLGSPHVARLTSDDDDTHDQQTQFTN